MWIFNTANVRLCRGSLFVITMVIIHFMWKPGFDWVGTAIGELVKCEFWKPEGVISPFRLVYKCIALISKCREQSWSGISPTNVGYINFSIDGLISQGSRKFLLGYIVSLPIEWSSRRNREKTPLANNDDLLLWKVPGKRIFSKNNLECTFSSIYCC